MLDNESDAEKNSQFVDYKENYKWCSKNISFKSKYSRVSIVSQLVLLFAQLMEQS